MDAAIAIHGFAMQSDCDGRRAEKSRCATVSDISCFPQSLVYVLAITSYVAPVCNPSLPIQSEQDLHRLDERKAQKHPKDRCRLFPSPRDARIAKHSDAAPTQRNNSNAHRLCLTGHPAQRGAFKHSLFLPVASEMGRQANQLARVDNKRGER